MELTSGEMTPSQMKEELLWIVELYRTSAFESVIVQYGWGCRLPVSELWVDHRVEIDQIVRFLGEAQTAGIWQIGMADIFLADPQNAATFLLCHESDVHLRTTHDAYIERVTGHWDAVGFPWSLKADESGQPEPEASR